MRPATATKNPTRGRKKTKRKRVPDLLCYHLAAEIRFDCCPRLRQPFPLVSPAVWALYRDTVRGHEAIQLSRTYCQLNSPTTTKNTLTNRAQTELLSAHKSENPEVLS